MSWCWYRGDVLFVFVLLGGGGPFVCFFLPGWMFVFFSPSLSYCSVLPLLTTCLFFFPSLLSVAMFFFFISSRCPFASSFPSPSSIPLSPSFLFPSCFAFLLLLPLLIPCPFPPFPSTLFFSMLTFLSMFIFLSICLSLSPFLLTFPFLLPPPFLPAATAHSHAHPDRKVRPLGVQEQGLRSHVEPALG